MLLFDNLVHLVNKLFHRGEDDGGDTKTSGPICEDEVLNTEWEHIKELRNYDENKRNNLCGLALSGGGIRSASFALGVLQALNRSNEFKNLDYLSTVSGGGYIGASLTWFLSHKGYGVDQKSFPFSVRGSPAGKGNRNTILNFIRQHGNYLTPGGGINKLSLFAVLVRTIFLSLAVYIPLLIFGFFVVDWLGGFKTYAVPGFPVSLNFFNWIVVALVGAFLFACIVYSLGTVLLRRPRSSFGKGRLSAFMATVERYRLRVHFQIWMGWLLLGVIVFAALGVLPVIREWIDGLWIKVAGESIALGGVSTFLGVVAGYLKFRRSRQVTEDGGSSGAGVLVWVASVLVIFGIFLLAYGVATDPRTPEIAIYFAAGASAVLGIFVNLNYISMHRMYRDRLMETFMPNLAAVRQNRWEPATQGDDARLSNVFPPQRNEKDGTETPPPYHIINTNVVLVNSRNPRYRGRGGDNFVLSALFCGSDATKWRATKNYMGDTMTLATAMAISGAAANPNAGVGGLGLTRNPFVSFLMTLMNLRLGYWAPNPTHAIPKFVKPNYFNPGYKGLKGSGFTENAYFIELTDGGHFENMGLYELVRRKVRVIIVADASADPKFTFGDFANAVERVRVDFGAEVQFKNVDTDLSHILPGSDGNNSNAMRTKYDLAERGFAIATIRYADKSEGTIYYIKPTITPKLPTDVYAYRSLHPEFPHQTTLDQFFDENQIEAYRALGYKLMERAIKHQSLFG